MFQVASYVSHSDRCSRTIDCLPNCRLRYYSALYLVILCDELCHRVDIMWHFFYCSGSSEVQRMRHPISQENLLSC